jgi:hypothetical protein
MTTRTRLPNRRASETFGVECNGQRSVASISRFADGSPAEIFISSGKPGSDADIVSKDSAIVASIALQYGVPVDVIRRALLRDLKGRAASSLGAALDILAGGPR